MIGILALLAAAQMTPEEFKKGVDSVHQICYIAYEEYQSKGTTTVFKKVLNQAPDRATQESLMAMCSLYSRGRNDQQQKGAKNYNALSHL